MDCFAAVMTGAGTGAIATVQLFGDTAEAVLAKVFRPAGTKPTEFKTGQILLGAITDGSKTIDRVTIGCEGWGVFAIHCHGNPLVVEMIMQRLRRCGATLLTAEHLLTKILTAQRPKNTIALEVQLAQLKAKTLEGTKIIANQVDVGLGKRAQDWLGGIGEISLDEIKAGAIRILQASQAARLIIYGCTAVLVGPPNSGKSTLLNCLAGRQKAIVTDIEGTTRDWVEATCQFGPLPVTLVDTAGLVRRVAGSKAEPLGMADMRIAIPKLRLRMPPAEPTVEQAAQRKTAEVLSQADLVLLVLDNSEPAKKFGDYIPERIADKKVITVLNKSDLPPKFDTSRLPNILSNTVQISAKSGTGVEDLKEIIRHTSGAADFEWQQPVCFTTRQTNLLRQIETSKSIEQANSIIMELLNGQVQAD